MGEGIQSQQKLKKINKIKGLTYLFLFPYRNRYAFLGKMEKKTFLNVKG